jgi:O-antigen/teichoic acid export membrane protein
VQIGTLQSGIGRAKWIPGIDGRMKRFALSSVQALYTRLRKNPIIRRIIRNSGYLLSSTAISAVLSMGQSVLAARLLGVAGFGILGTITQFTSVINRFTSARMSELVVNYVGEYNVNGKKQYAAAVFKVASLTEFVLSIFAFGLVVLLAPLGARYLAHDPSLRDIFAIYGLMILANIISESSTGLLSVFDKFRSIAIINVVQSVLTMLLIVGAFVVKGGLMHVVLAYLLGKAISALMITFVALWQAGVHWGKNWWRAPISLLVDRRRELIRFGLSSNLSVTLNLVTRDSELLWLSALSTPLQVGYYKLTLAILNIILLPVQPLLTATYRDLALEVARKQWENVRYLLRSGSIILSAYSVPACLGLAAFGPWLIAAIYSPEFLPTTYHGLLIVLPSVLLVNVFYWNRKLLLTLGKPEFPVKVNLVAALLKIVGILLLVPRWGALGMAVLLSAFFMGTTTAQVVQGLRSLRQAVGSPSSIAGS